jgi:hypothetical protein
VDLGVRYGRPLDIPYDQSPDAILDMVMAGIGEDHTLPSAVAAGC